MADAALNFNEEELKKQQALYGVYRKLYDGMKLAQTVDPPQFGDVEVDSEGNVDEAVLADINNKIAEYSDIMMKNSAFLFAGTMMEASASGGGSGESGGSGGSGGGVVAGGYVSRFGDNMSGNLTALYGFQAGTDGKKIFEVSTNKNGDKLANVTGSLNVSENITVGGKINVSAEGLWLGSSNILYNDGQKLVLSYENIGLNGNVEVDGSIQVGEIGINESGIFWGDKEFYHSGNSNKKEVDWTMGDAFIYEDANVFGNLFVTGEIDGRNGFSFSYGGTPLMCSGYSTHLDQFGESIMETYISLYSDLDIASGYGIKVGKQYAVNVNDRNEVSFSAPGRIMNLGDASGNKLTKNISLKSAIKDSTNSFYIVTPSGEGNFPSSFSAGAGTGSAVMKTYYHDISDKGVVFSGYMRIGNDYGPKIYSTATSKLEASIPYSVRLNGELYTYDLGLKAEFKETTSQFRDLHKQWSSSLHLSTDGEFITFDNPVEAKNFSIKSELYKTQLAENVLFLNDGAFIEGCPDGMEFSGNAYFSGNIQSNKFASGFAGYGYGIVEDKAASGYVATFDDLVVRRKLRVFELEVQKISATNGSLWVSDSCSGDEVIKM